MNEMKDELMLLFEAHGKYDLFLSIESRVSSDVAILVDIYLALNDLNRFLEGKDINNINDFNTINAFVAKLVSNLKRKSSFLY